MIDELTTYISGIQDQFPLYEFVEGPAEGLHIMVQVQDGKVQLFDQEVYKSKKRKDDGCSNFLKEICMPREMYIDFINHHKAIRGVTGSRIRSAVPFALKFYKLEFDEGWEKWIPKEPNDRIKNKLEEIKNGEKSAKRLKGKDKKQKEELIFREKLSLIFPAIKEYIRKYFEGVNEVCKLEYDQVELNSVKIFQAYCINNLSTTLASLADKIVQLSKKDYITILLLNATEDDYKKAFKNYRKDYVFNTTAVDKTIVDEQEYGLSNFNNTAGDKKPYLKHLTAPFFVNNRIPIKEALLLDTFERYRQEGVLKIRPLPVFIDRVELNNEVVNVVKTEGNQVGFHKIIRTLFENKASDLGNYYLFYFWGGELKDLDFVSSFSYSLDIRFLHVIPEADRDKDFHVKNIFEFENKILQPIFNNLLIQKRKNGTIGYRYFDEIDNNPKYNTAATWNLVMKYRKAFYGFIYKSRRQAVTTAMFHNIMQKSILDDIRHDEIKDEHHTKTNDIRKKLNIWFSLWNFFEKENKTNNKAMANKIEQHQKIIRNIISNESDNHLKTDDEFAFASGQVIYYLLDQSKAGNKTHALLEPFLQKTDVQEFKKAIANTFDAYKHEISFGKGRFEKLCSEIMDYQLDNNLKELLPYMLAGYFSSTLIYEKSQTQKSKNDE
jgi:CRISPR-associated protein Csh1